VGARRCVPALAALVLWAAPAGAQTGGGEQAAGARVGGGEQAAGARVGGDEQAGVAQVGGDAASAEPSRSTVRATTVRGTTTLVEPQRYDRAPPGRSRTAREVLRAAAAVPAVRRVRAEHTRAYARAYLAGPGRWQVSWYDPGRPAREEVAQVVVDDRSGRVLEAWTGVQVAWPMARGYPGAFGRSVNAPWVWLGLCALFVLPFARPPLRLLHLDLAVLLAFSASYAFFNAAELGVSVPSAYPLLAYLLVRMLAIAASRSRAAADPAPPARAPLRLAVPAGFLVLALVFLLGFRVALNVTDGNVIDVGYASVVGADRLAGGEPLYGAFPAGIERGDTYGPALYAAYVPFEQVLSWSGSWDALPAAHAAALAFDLGCVLLLFLLGRRIRGPGLGLLLAYLWAAYPFTLLAANSGANDAIVPLLVLAALLAAGRPAARGAMLALAGLTKLAPLALAPLFATYDGGSPRRSRARAALLFAVAFGATAVAVIAPFDLGVLADRTLGFQAGRDSPFSIWGGHDVLQAVSQIGAVALALVVAVLPRRRDLVSLAALAAAVLIALQLTTDHWFYLYLVWFAPLVWIAILAPYEAGAGRSTGSIESARRGSEARMSTALTHGSSSAES
jgi:hypothetical protein